VDSGKSHLFSMLTAIDKTITVKISLICQYIDWFFC